VPTKKLLLLALSLLAVGAARAQTAAATDSELKQRSALHRDHADRELVLGAARAGRRIVAVGDHGVVLLSDDDGRSFRQAKSVPTRATLTGVAFADAQHGWAVGHWGSIVHTADGGETWTLQRTDTATDRPLFSVHFSDSQHGLAVGLWSLALATSDGGAHWNPLALPPPPAGGKADRNLFAVFPGAGSTIYVAAERGTVLRTADFGASWNYLETGYKGSFWTGTALADGTLLVAGLRGTIYRSEDGGKSWSQSASGSGSSITALAATPTSVVAVGADGTVLHSADQGRTFTANQLDERPTLTAVITAADGKALVFSDRGPLPKATVSP
jgi:photosystem II stability/assembly factor-like uncharacterized protein